ncbi:uncharacterized protein LOC128528623 isoform X2 [Clarias gariepinus]|uniref:uncharacterized protein LOC128528623 isoform X2 n=1 Tax=Clarias gariepinus TaxID=13013 RepID=UPI00234DE427|nr:uncharacterized protein LOC128528623 isoform X2 [Clarias gariepinus]XP_053357575.1 uncharacterized protein LOC128528623 isoform X2 [Clarias gariepinus]XP_053357577.1 uncharacterized protein LOC128528623 isoform X2 [Clarias gariepinus]
MASVLEYTVPSLDTENLLEQRVKLNQLGVLDPELKTNLQFAISAMDKLPNTLKKNAELVVEGEKTLVKIRAGRPSLRCVVFQGHEGTVLHQTIHVNRELLPEDIHEAFFIGHDCPHDEPCWMQARTALNHLFKCQLQINIICKEVRVTFSSPEPEGTIMVPSK